MFNADALIESLTLMLQGMVGIFIVAAIIIAVTALFNLVTKKK